MGCGASTSNVVPLVETRDHTAHKDHPALVGAEPIIAQRDAPRDPDGSSTTRPARNSRMVAESPPATPPHEPVADIAAVNTTVGDIMGSTHSMAMEGHAARSDSIGERWRYGSKRTASPLRVSATSPASRSGNFGATTDLQRMPTRLPPLTGQSKASLAGLPLLISSAPANGRRAVSEARLSAALAACSIHEDGSVPDLEVRAGRRNRLAQTTNKSAEDEALRAQIFATKLEFIESRRASSSQQDQHQQQREQNVRIRW